MKRVGSIRNLAGFCGVALATLSFPSLADGKQDLVERGRYIVKIAGCNDCHTPGYGMSAGQIPEAQWLTGDVLGWKGDWGTTYATNLRISLQAYTETEWVAYAKDLKARPPMPWFVFGEMKDEDLKAIYQFVRYLGPAGSPAPAYVPPGQEPKPPFIQFPSAPPKP